MVSITYQSVNRELGKGDAILPLCLSLLCELLCHRKAADRPGTEHLQKEETPPAYIIGKHCRREKLTLLFINPILPEAVVDPVQAAWMVCGTRIDSPVLRGGARLEMLSEDGHVSVVWPCFAFGHSK